MAYSGNRPRHAAPPDERSHIRAGLAAGAALLPKAVSLAPRSAAVSVAGQRARAVTPTSNAVQTTRPPSAAVTKARPINPDAIIKGAMDKLGAVQQTVAPDQGQVNKLNTVARSWLGVPYLWGGTTRKGVDCSGYVINVMRAFGVRLPRTSRQQATVGRVVDNIRQARAGDLLFYRNNNGTVHHVAIYDGRGGMYEAPRRGVPVRHVRARQPDIIRRVLPTPTAPQPTGNFSSLASRGYTGQGWQKGLSYAEAFIISRESTFRPTADNPTSTAYGIGQLLEYNRKKYLGTNYNTRDPNLQLRAFRAYVRDRYGSATNAMRFWIVHHWYAIPAFGYVIHSHMKLPNYFWS